MIEHNLDVIKVADRIIDLGPEGGDEGGDLIATGTPEQVARRRGSHTGEFLTKVLVDGGRSAGRAAPGARAAGPRRPRPADQDTAGVNDRPHLGPPTRADLKLWAQKWRWYERNSLPWNRARIHWEFMRRRAFVRWPVHGNVLEALREGRLEIGAHTLLEPHVWLTAPDAARIRIGSGTFLNIAVMVAALDLVEIGDHCMLANGCFVTDSNHRFDDPARPVPWQGFTTSRPDPDRRQRVVRRRRRDHERRHDRGAVRDRRQFGRDERHPAVLGRGRRARPRASDDRVLSRQAAGKVGPRANC